MDALRKAVLARKRNLGSSEGTDEDGKDKRGRGEDEESNNESDSSSSDNEEDTSNSQSSEHESAPTKLLRSAGSLAGTDEGVILTWIDKIMNLWDQEIAKLPQTGLTAAQRGEKAAATECAERIEPLREALLERKLDKAILDRLVGIVRECEQREYRRAFSEYLQLTIGNAPWPIGVTMVGIHARSGREKIAEAKVQHIMKDEVKSAYLTSVKRLMSRCQSAFPPDAPSKRMN